MFLWAQLVLDTLKDQHSLYELRMTLQRLPNGLAGVYVDNASLEKRPR